MVIENKENEFEELNVAAPQQLCRIRSVREVARYCKQMDPETQLTEYTLRKMIAQGTIPAVKSGAKYLINLDRLLEMLNNVGTAAVNA